MMLFCKRRPTKFKYRKWLHWVFAGLFSGTANSSGNGCVVPECQQNQLERIQVVSSTKTERSLADVPVRTQVVNAEQVERLHAKDLNEALKYVPGLQLRPIHGKSGYGIWLQGLDANRVLVLVDGHPVSASTGSAVDTTQVAVTDIERIEIIKGAMSALYGTSAMGGVVNIITRKPEQGVSASVTTSGGSYGEQNVGSNPFAMHHLKAQWHLSREQFDIGFLGDVRHSDGFSNNPDSYSTQGWAGYKANVGLQLGYRPTEATKIRFSPRRYQEDLLTKTTQRNPPFVNQVEKIDLTSTDYLGLTLNHQFEQGSDLQLSLMHEQFDGETQQNTILTSFVDQQRNTDINQKLASVQYNLPLGNHLLTLGAQASTHSMQVVQTKRFNNAPAQRIVEVDNQRAQTQELFAQNSWFVNDQWELMPGLRLHRDKTFGEHLAPMVNGVYRQQTTSGQVNWRLGLGNGYRVPDLKERYYLFDHSHIGYKVMGNADLQPESSTSFQAGVEWLAQDRRFELSLFRNEIKNLIETDEDQAESAAQQLLIYRYRNFAEALTQGVELNGFVPLNSALSLDVGYSFMQAKDRLTKKDLPRRPTHEVKLGLDWASPQPGLVLSVKANFQSAQFENSDNTSETPAFTVWDIKANYELNRQWLLFAGVDNLTSVQKDFTLADSRPEQPRYVYVGARWQY
ncbi:TonB-dependent receptor [Thiomicrospira microaerophila]|uniref:TonB-dependent receptor plug domain-containing protein n=1 Tax=Thiomicrospira microaerophila TaxID=406020 RepID=UPI0020105717|nr:TonB-dependent receptor [Thiomicrospira microaerophila]UQB42187.1 TonB-dependent receptor [Thiomicrospira microaerophila]